MTRCVAAEWRPSCCSARPRRSCRDGPGEDWPDQGADRGTRGSSIPFAFINEKNEWIGFSIDILEAIRARLEKKLSKPIKLEKKEVETATRVQEVASRSVDVECGSTTILGAETTASTSPSTFSSPAASSGEKGERNQGRGGRGRQAGGGSSGNDG